MCFALACVVTLEMEAIDGVGGRGREERHQHLRKGYHVNTQPPFPLGQNIGKHTFSLVIQHYIAYLLTNIFFLKKMGVLGGRREMVSKSNMIRGLVLAVPCSYHKRGMAG